jgi:hypothetical protein
LEPNNGDHENRSYIPLEPMVQEYNTTQSNHHLTHMMDQQETHNRDISTQEQTTSTQQESITQHEEIGTTNNTTNNMNSFLNEIEITTEQDNTTAAAEETQNINHIVEQQLNDNTDILLTSLNDNEQDNLIRILLNDIKGDTLDEKQSDHLRVMFQNINSLRPNTTDKWDATIRQMFEFKADIVGLCETCTNWKNRTLKKLFQLKANRILKNPVITTTTTTLNYIDNYLPGGCCQITSNSWTTRCEASIYDDFRLGRWIGTTFRVSPTKRLHVVTAYRVCEMTPTASTSLSTAAQQQTMLLARGIINPNPRKQFIEDFITQFQSLCDDSDNYLLLSLDANANLGHDREGLDKLVSECNLVDIYTTINQDYSEFPTQQRGSKKIDFMLGTRNLIPYISKCGYVKFNEGFDSDHRAIFCDISHTILHNDHIPNSQRRRIIGSNSTNREGERYIKHLYRNLQRHNIFEEVQRIENSIKTQNTEEDKEAIQYLSNLLDEHITKLMISAEDNTVSVKDLALWSPILAQSNLVIQYWNIVIKGARQHTNVTKRLRAITGKMNEATRTQIQRTSGSATKATRKAIKNHNRLVKEHKKHREDHLQQRVDDLNVRGDGKGKMEVEYLMKKEYRRADFAKIRHILRKKKSKGITTIEVPSTTEPDKWDIITIPKEIEGSLLDRGVDHFGQAKNTPFAKGCLARIMGYKGTNKNVENLIKKQQKTVELNNQPHYVQQIIDKLSDGNNLPTIDSGITYEEFIAGINKWKESTSTSPSGRHLGHYKILTKLNVIDENNTNLGQSILGLYHQIINIVTTLGITLDR